MLALVVFALAACGDDAGGIDAAPIDAGRSLDSGTALCGDASQCANQPFATTCEAGRCVECIASADCAAAERSLGPTCDTTNGYCTCASAQDCQANSNGPVCNPITGSCGCTTLRDCPEGQICKLEPYLGSGIRTCRTE